MLVTTIGSAVFGITATTVSIEVHIDRGINFTLVGLPDSAVKESQQRVKTAIEHIEYKWPGKGITINMAPADIRKEGAAYDLPLAIGILTASEQVSIEGLEEVVMMGEMSLDGTLRPIKGALLIALEARDKGFKSVILPSQNSEEASIVSDIEVIGCSSLTEVINHLTGVDSKTALTYDCDKMFFEKVDNYPVDFIDVKGQDNIKRAFEIAAAGGHNIILIGPPGSGKTMLAKRLPSILPPMNLNEALETTKIHSVSGRMKKGAGIVATRPFRAPHHTISDVALVGGGGFPQPGEISLAHNGVLFLDELPEFKRTVLEVLRQPLEDRLVSISRARFSVEYPAGLMLVAAMNPCPCGYFNHPTKDCSCPPGVVQKYLSKVSGPLLDRIDLHIEVTPVSFDELSKNSEGQMSSEIRQRVIKARNIQEARFSSDENMHCNAQMAGKEIALYCEISSEGKALLKTAIKRLDLSARAYDRILKVARTIADLDASASVLPQHLAEAINYRSLDREGWGG